MGAEVSWGFVRLDGWLAAKVLMGVTSVKVQKQFDLELIPRILQRIIFFSRGNVDKRLQLSPLTF